MNNSMNYSVTARYRGGVQHTTWHESRRTVNRDVREVMRHRNLLLVEVRDFTVAARKPDAR